MLFQGLRITLLMGAFGTALGAWIKVLGVAPDLFYVALIGQTITAMSQV
jgi:FLVCR family feline leukemia virus subgroup C receptor-related protein